MKFMIACMHAKSSKDLGRKMGIERGHISDTNQPTFIINGDIPEVGVDGINIFNAADDNCRIKTSRRGISAASVKTSKG